MTRLYAISMEERNLKWYYDFNIEDWVSDISYCLTSDPHKAAMESRDLPGSKIRRFILEEETDEVRCVGIRGDSSREGCPEDRETPCRGSSEQGVSIAGDNSSEEEVEEQGVCPVLDAAENSNYPPYTIDDVGTRGAPGNLGHYIGKIQPIDLIMEQGLTFSEGCVVKYVCRWKKKDGILDLRKARWYLQGLIDKEEAKEMNDGNDGK